MNIQMETYLVTQGDRTGGRGTESVVRAAIDGGIDVVQLREKHASARARYALGRDLRALTREAGVPLVVNDRVDIAKAVGADGVHLGDDDLPVSVAREHLGNDAVVGRSVSTLEGARAAERDGADYLGVGGVFATQTKDVADEDAEIGTETVADIASTVDVPIVAIGGITADNAASVVAAGASGVAVVSAITDAEDPAAATRELRRAVAEGRAAR